MVGKPIACWGQMVMKEPINIYRGSHKLGVTRRVGLGPWITSFRDHRTTRGGDVKSGFNVEIVRFSPISKIDGGEHNI
jgi:hypothetical protein